MTKVLIISDSTQQWVRPYRNHINDFTYTELLFKEDAISLFIVSMPGMTSTDALQYYWNNAGGLFFDFCIISVGINDLTPRSYPRWLWKINNNLPIKYGFLAKMFDLIYRLATNTKLQSLCSKYGISKPWVSKKEFYLNLSKLQELILKESDANILFLSLPMVSKRVQDILPGIEKNVIAYKNEFQHLKNDRTFVIDIENLFIENPELYNPEGIHYSAQGHKKIFDAIMSIIHEKRLGH